MDASAAADLQSVIELWLATRKIDRLAGRLCEARDEEIERTSHYATEPAVSRRSIATGRPRRVSTTGPRFALRA